jgi:ZIP family zinc transporter
VYLTEIAEGLGLSTLETVGLGAIAGLTIFLGLPMGRMRSSSIALRTFLTGLSAGILVFLLIEILAGPLEDIEHILEGEAAGSALGMSAVYLVGLAAGLLGLLALGRFWRRPGRKASMGPGAMAVAEAQQVADAPREALRLGMTIAAGIGLHNFSEGLAIGTAANAGEVSLALLLVIGFALHNATEGFGIVGPLAAAGVRAPWRWILLAGLIGGGPTFLGTIIGTSVSSIYLSAAFLAMAGGAIIFVVAELFAAGRRLSWSWTVWGVAAGFSLGFLTEIVLELA